MKRPAALTLVIELRKRERDRVAGIAAQARRDADAAAGTLRMLTDYRNDYESRSPKQAKGQTDTRKVRVHEAFVGKLGQAIGDQEKLLDNLAARQEQQRIALAERERRVKALETLAQRRESERMKRQESLEQKQTDEFAAQAHARSRTRKANHDR